MSEVSAKKFAATKKKLTANSVAFREFCREHEIDQLSGEKIPGGLKAAYTVHNDLEKGEAVMKKNALRKGAEKFSIYTKENAEKRVKIKNRWLANDRVEPGKKKKAPAKKSAAKKPTAKKAPARARKVRKVPAKK